MNFIPTKEWILSLKSLDFRTSYAYYAANQALEEPYRVKVSKAIISAILEAEPETRLNRNDFMTLANLIVEIFATEVAETYYQPSVKGGVPTGKLYSSYSNLRNALATNGLIARDSRGSKSSQNENEKKLPKNLNLTPKSLQICKSEGGFVPGYPGNPGYHPNPAYPINPGYPANGNDDMGVYNRAANEHNPVIFIKSEEDEFENEESNEYQSEFSIGTNNRRQDTNEYQNDFNAGTNKRRQPSIPDSNKRMRTSNDKDEYYELQLEAMRLDIMYKKLLIEKVTLENQQLMNNLNQRPL